MVEEKSNRAGYVSRGLEANSAYQSGVVPTSQGIMEQFKPTQNLTTIQLQSTILYDDHDSDRGSQPFRELIGALFNKIQYSDPKPRALWVVSDETELKHVLRELKKHDHNLFENLNAHASVALAAKTSSHHGLLSETAMSGTDPELRQALTAVPADDAYGYNYFSHFKPSAEKGWESGPHCMPLDNVPAQLDDVFRT